MSIQQSGDVQAFQPTPEQTQKSMQLQQLPLDQLVALLTQAGTVLPHTDIQYELTRRQITAMTAAKRAADRFSWVLIGLTSVLLVLTGVLVWLTSELVTKSH